MYYERTKTVLAWTNPLTILGLLLAGSLLLAAIVAGLVVGVATLVAMMVVELYQDARAEQRERKRSSLLNDPEPEPAPAVSPVFPSIIHRTPHPMEGLAVPAMAACQALVEAEPEQTIQDEPIDKYAMALKDVQEGMSVRLSAKKNGVGETTIRKRLKQSKLQTA